MFLRRWASKLACRKFDVPQLRAGCGTAGLLKQGHCWLACELAASRSVPGVQIKRPGLRESRPRRDLQNVKAYLFAGTQVVVELSYLYPAAFFSESLVSATVRYHLLSFFSV